MTDQYVPPELWGPHFACCEHSELLSFYLRRGTGHFMPIAQAEVHVSSDEQANNRLVANFLRTVANLLDADSAFEQLTERME